MVWLALAAGTPPATAQEAPPVRVQFVFGDPTVANLHGTEAARTAVENAVSGALAGVFTPVLQYWPAGGGAGTYPLLQLQMKSEGSRWLVVADMYPADQQPASYTARIELYAAGEIAARGGFPPKDELPARIESRLRDFYQSAAERSRLQEKVAEGAVLGSAAHVTSAATAPMAILPLAWKKYCSLATSDFALEYTLPNGARVMVLGQGTGEPGQFTPDAPQFQGVMVRPRKWVRGGVEDDVAAHHAEMPALVPRFFRLKKLTTDPSACIDLGGAPLSVVR